MKMNQKDTQSKQGQTQKRFLQSLFVCTGIVSQLLQSMERQLPPDTQRVLTYSRLMMNKATQKIVGINLLESEYFNNFTVNDVQQQSSSEFQQVCLKNQKNKQLLKDDDLTNSYYYPNKLTPTFQGRVSSPKLVQDEQIVLKKSGIKFTKKQELRNLIKHKTSNTCSSFHSSFNPTCQRINTKHSLYETDHQKKQFSNFYHQSSSENQYLNQTIVNSSSLATSNFQVKSPNKFLNNQRTNKNEQQEQSLEVQQKNAFNCKRISGRMNSNRFVNLDEYYQHKSKQNKRNNNKILFKGNSLQLQRNDDKQNQSLFRKNINSYHPTWPYRKFQFKDQDDIVINKLRERKLKFYKDQHNSNEDLFASNKDSKTLNETQKISQKEQFGAMKAFDYNGCVMPTVKYGSLKISSHYQDMQIQVTNHDESLLKRKRERKGYILGGGINLNLVDHQRFLPHPKYNNDPLIQKQGILMKQNIGYLLKKGVSLRPKQDNSVNSCSISGFNDQQQTHEKINKSNFEFLNNQQIEPKNVKFQQFIKYKKLPLPSSKSIASKKRIVDQAFLWEESLLSKKSISIKGQKSKTLLQDTSNKVHKSTNSKAFQMLINHNQMNSNPINKVHFQKSQINGLITPPGGVLKKSPLNKINKIISQEIEPKLPKKKVRIA